MISLLFLCFDSFNFKVIIKFISANGLISATFYLTFMLLIIVKNIFDFDYNPPHTHTYTLEIYLFCFSKKEGLLSRF